MTKVIILGQEPDKKELKPIEFVKTLGLNGNGFKTITKAKDCKEIVLLARNYKNTEMDLFFISFCNSNENQLYLGHFNDGVV